MKIQNSSFILSAALKEQYPDMEVPEIAFAGRSNVGKSSLINMLINRKGLAKTSSTPGKTRTINFYNVDEKFRIVDLPGYGYAKVSKANKVLWAKVIEDYLNGRENLLEIFLLVDIRHKPSQEDQEMYEWIKRKGYNGIVIATKADKLTKNQISKQIQMLQKEFKMTREDVIVPISAETRLGKYDIWSIFNELFQVNGYEIAFEKQDGTKL